MKNKRSSLIDRKWFRIAFWFAVIIIAWEIGASYVASVKPTPQNIMPHLYQILLAAVSPQPVSAGQTATAVVLQSAGATLGRALIGFLLGALAGFGLALVMKLSGIVEKLILPYLMIIQLIPVIGMAPIILAMTGDINRSRIIIAAILSFYPVATNVLAGFHAVGKDQYDLMATYAASRRQIYGKVLIPSARHYLFTGLKIAAPMAITASILVDTLQGDGGLGCVLSQALKHAMSIYVFWLIVFFSAIVGVLSTLIIGWVENLTTPGRKKGGWKRSRGRNHAMTEEEKERKEHYGRLFAEDKA